MVGDRGWRVNEREPPFGTIQSGSLRALAVTSSKRLAQLPDVPTVMEAGIPDFDVTTWNGLVAPAGTPRAIVAKLEAAALDALKDPEVAARFDKVGATVAPLAVRTSRSSTSPRSRAGRPS